MVVKILSRTYSLHLKKKFHFPFLEVVCTSEIVVYFKHVVNIPEYFWSSQTGVALRGSTLAQYGDILFIDNMSTQAA